MTIFTHFQKFSNARFFIILVSCLIFFSCQDGNVVAPGGGNGNGSGHQFSGSIYFDWSDEGVLKIDLTSGKKSTALPGRVDRYSWDITRDGKRILTTTDDPDDRDANIFTLSDIKTGQIITQFKYYPYGSLDMTYARLSPNEQRIALLPTVDYGIIILDMEGNELHNLTGFEGEAFDNSTQIEWMPDNTLLFTIESGIYRTNADFTQANRIIKPDFQEWRDIAVSPDGNKIAFRGGNHIWMMNSDGGNLKQITTSSEIEKCGTFSPDGKYLLIGTNYDDALLFGAAWDLTIIPADGKLYNVDFYDNPDKEVFFFQNETYERHHQPGDGYMLWR